MKRKFFLAIVFLVAFSASLHFYFDTTLNIDKAYSKIVQFHSPYFSDWGYCRVGDKYSLYYCKGSEESVEEAICDINFKPLNGEVKTKMKIEQMSQIDGNTSAIISLGKKNVELKVSNGSLKYAKGYFDNGNPAFECQYDNGKENGIWKNYNEQGGLINEIEYKNGRPTGQLKSYNSDGSILSEGTPEKCFQYGANTTKEVKKDKYGKIYDKTGRLISEMKVKVGDYFERREYTDFDADKKITASYVSTGYFDDSEIKRNETYMNGKPVRRTIYFLPQQIEQHFDDNGILRREEFYRDGLWNGFNRWYDANENLRVEKEYKNMQQDGMSRWFDKGGHLIWMAYYKDGKLFGQNSCFPWFGEFLLILLTALILPVLIGFPFYKFLKRNIKNKVIGYLLIVALLVLLLLGGCYLAYLECHLL